MAQIVIDIDDKTYKAFMEVISVNLGRSNQKGIIEKCLNAIKHGKVLPKGHGALKDANELNDYFWDNRSRLFHSSDCRIAIDKAETIIEADKEERK